MQNNRTVISQTSSGFALVEPSEEDLEEFRFLMKTFGPSSRSDAENLNVSSSSGSSNSKIVQDKLKTVHTDEKANTCYNIVNKKSLSCGMAKSSENCENGEISNSGIEHDDPISYEDFHNHLDDMLFKKQKEFFKSAEVVDTLQNLADIQDKQLQESSKKTDK